MISIKPNFTGRDKQIITEILNSEFEMVIPYVKDRIKNIKKTLEDDHPVITSEEKTAILVAINERPQPDYDHSLEEIQIIRNELERAVVEAILNIP